MKLNIQKRALPFLCALALIVTCGFCFAVPSLAADVEDATLLQEITFDNGITVQFPFLLIARSTLVVFAGYDGDIVYIFETVEEGLLSNNNRVACIGESLADDGSYCTATVMAYGNIYISVLSVNDGYAKYDANFARKLSAGSVEDPRELINGFICIGSSAKQGLSGLVFNMGDTLDGEIVPYEELAIPWPSVYVDAVSLGSVSTSPYYPGTAVQFNAEVTGAGIVPGSPESTVYWYLYGNTSPDTFLEDNPYGDAVLHIANDETATSLEIEAISTYDSTKSATYTLPITYPLEGVQIIPGDTQYLMESGKRREIQFSLLLPNGEPFDYQLLEWTTHGDYGQYFRIDDTGLLIVEANAPAGANCTVRFAYQSDPSTLSPDSVTVQIVTQQEGIFDELEDMNNGGSAGGHLGNKGDELDDKNEQLGGVVGDLNNAQVALPTTPGDVSAIVDIGLLDQSVSLMTTILDYEAMGLGDLMPILGLLAGLAVIIYLVFGKRG